MSTNPQEIRVLRAVAEISLRRVSLIQAAAREGRELPSDYLLGLTYEMVRCHRFLMGEATQEDIDWLLNRPVRIRAGGAA